MKLITKLVAITLLMVLAHLPSSAQTSRFSLSVNSLTTNFNYGGANKTFRGDKKDYKGWQAGFSYQAGVTPHFSLVPELYFASKGGALKSGNSITGSASTLRVNSLDIPVLARLHMGKLYLNAGPYGSYLVGGRRKIKASQSSASSSEKISFGRQAGDFRRWDAGWQAGAGYNFGMKKSILTLDVRYGYGMIDLSRDVERYNRVLNISLVVSKPGKTKRTTN